MPDPVSWEPGVPQDELLAAMDEALKILDSDRDEKCMELFVGIFGVSPAVLDQHGTEAAELYRDRYVDNEEDWKRLEHHMASLYLLGVLTGILLRRKSEDEKS